MIEIKDPKTPIWVDTRKYIAFDFNDNVFFPDHLYYTPAYDAFSTQYEFALDPENAPEYPIILSQVVDEYVVEKILRKYNPGNVTDILKKAEILGIGTTMKAEYMIQRIRATVLSDDPSPDKILDDDNMEAIAWFNSTYKN